MKIKDILSDFKWKSHKTSKGIKHFGKTFYVIRNRSKRVGLFSYIITALGYIKEYQDKGLDYIPVIDMKHYESPYQESKQDNVWEYYFEQPAGYQLQDIRYASKICFCNGLQLPPRPELSVVLNKEELCLWRELFHKYIRLNSETTQYTENIIKELFGNKGRILGVLCRGTDYRQMKPSRHPIQPEVDEVIVKAKNAMQEQNCEYLYLATEDEEIYKQFLEVFKDKLIFYDIPFRKGNSLITTIEVEREHDRRRKGLEYLTQIVLLSKCNCFLGTACGGTYGAMLMTDGYEWEYLWNLGQYN